MLRFTLLAVAAIVAGCSRVEADSPGLRRQSRVQRAHDLAAAPPKVMRHSFDSGELLRIDVLVADPHGLLETQHCYVWRDTEFRTASMQCPPGIDLGPGHGE